MNLGVEVLEAFRWTAILRFIGQLFTWVLTLVVARLLTPGDYGLMAEATIFTTLLALVGELGLGTAVVQKSEMMSENVLRQVFGMVLLVNLGLSVVLFSISSLIAEFFAETRLEPIIQVLSSQFILMSFSVMPHALLLRQLRLKEKSLVDLCAILVGGFLSLWLARNGWGVWSLVWGVLAINVARAVGMNLLVSAVLRPNFSVRGMREIISFGTQVTGQKVLWSIYSQSDTFVAAKVLGNNIVGIYSMAMHLASLPMQKVNGIINEVIFPAFSRIQSEPGEVRRHFLKAVRLICFFAFPVFWGLSSVAPEVVMTLLGSSWKESAQPLQILTVIMPLLMVTNIFHTTVTALGRPQISLTTLAISCVLMPLAFVVGTRFGLLGLCVAWTVAFPIIFVIMVSLARPVLGVGWIEVLAAMAMPALAGAGTYAAVVTTKLFYLGVENSISRLAILIMIGTAVYCGMVLATYRDGYREVLGLVRR